MQRTQLSLKFLSGKDYHLFHILNKIVNRIGKIERCREDIIQLFANFITLELLKSQYNSMILRSFLKKLKTKEGR